MTSSWSFILQQLNKIDLHLCLKLQVRSPTVTWHSWHNSTETFACGAGVWNWIFVNLFEHQSSVTCFLKMFLKIEEVVFNNLFSCWAGSSNMMRGKDCETEIFCLILPSIIVINNLYVVGCRKCFLVRVCDILNKPQTAWSSYMWIPLRICATYGYKSDGYFYPMRCLRWSRMV